MQHYLNKLPANIADDTLMTAEIKTQSSNDCNVCHGQRAGRTVSTNPNSTFDEVQWVIRIRKTLEENVGDDDQTSSIYEVPKPLLSSKPEAYIPQLIALGPYHHFREELHDMARYKIYAAKRTQSQLPNKKFQHLVDHFMKHEHQIRSHYYRYLKVSVETFVWMMAIDTCFLIEFLQIFATGEGNTCSSGLTSHFLDSKGGTLQHSMLLGDVVKLENQIPLFLLHHVLQFQFSSSEVVDGVLSSLLTGFLKEVCPIKMIDVPECMDVTQYSHLLDYLYHSIVPKSYQKLEENYLSKRHQEKQSALKKSMNALSGCLYNACKTLALTIIRCSWRVAGCVPVVSEIKNVAQEFNITPDHLSKHAGQKLAQPLLEEITIPSVSELVMSGIKFYPTNGDVSTVEFDAKTATFYLPTIDLDFNTEVVLRNLVAYEASLGSRPLVFSRYVELMNGIVDTANDAKILSKSGVIQNHLKTDDEVAELWNGMTKSVRLTRVPALDKVIEDVNKYYNNKWSIKVRKLTKKSAVFSWKFLLFIALILIAVVMSMQIFCMAHGCVLKSNFS